MDSDLDILEKNIGKLENELDNWESDLKSNPSDKFSSDMVEHVKSEINAIEDEIIEKLEKCFDQEIIAEKSVSNSKRVRDSVIRIYKLRRLLLKLGLG